MKTASNPSMGRQDGAVAVAFIALAVLLLGFVAFAMEVGRLYVSKAELQNAADACALSASAALTGANADQLQVAEDFGMTAGRRNLVGMQGSAVTIVADRDITFSETLGGAYQTKTAAAANALKMRYVRCTLSEPDISPLMLQVVNLLPGQKVGANTVRASAVASREPSKSNCSLPLAICKKAGSTAPNFGYAVGEWLIGRFNSQDNINGKFKWVDFPGYDKTKDLKALLDGSGQCDLEETASLTPTQGDVNSLAPNWNWRFGVVKNSGPPANALPPDWSGYAYNGSNWPQQADAFGDFSNRRASHAPWNDVPKLSGGWNASSTETHAAGGDRRLAALPFVDCSTWGPGAKNSQPILGWACVLMLNPVANPANDDMGLEYRGPGDDLEAGCVTSGAPGGPTAGGPKVPALVQ
jgi:Flp pilus assembly protein TadG